MEWKYSRSIVSSGGSPSHPFTGAALRASVPLAPLANAPPGTQAEMRMSDWPIARWYASKP